MSGLAEILDENARLRAALATEHGRNRHLESSLCETSERLTKTSERLSEAEALLRERDQALQTRDAMIEALKASAEELARKLQLIEHKASGPASQRYIPEAQELLPFPGDVAPPPRAPKHEPEAEAAGDEKPTRTSKPGGKRRGRDQLKHLRARTVRCKAAADAACARCGGPLKVIGQVTTHRVEWVPSQLLVDDVVRDKCACPRCPGEGVLTVPAPYALDRALCGNSLLARVIVDKFVDHIPLNRQVKRMAREGFEVGSNTLAGWVKGGAEVLHVLALAIKADLMTQSMVQGDDTGLPVQDGEDGTLRKGRLWAFTDQEQVYYAFTATKEGEHPATLLKDFEGKLLLVDGGTEFNQLVREKDLSRGGCWAHLRSYFFDARLHHPNEAALALGTLRDLFLIEREAWGQPPEAVLAVRKARAEPLVDGFFVWVRALAPIVRPSSKLGEALAYALRQEQTMRLFLRHGELPMHNNLSELLLRQAVVGRKNWLFARSEGGALAAADLYTLVGSCTLQGIDPHAYLVDVLGRLLDHPRSRIAELTPKRWRLAKEAHTAGAR